MKKIILTSLALITISFANAQESKFYIGVSAGLATGGGVISEGLDSNGLNLGFNSGFRFSESWGATLNLTSSGFGVKDDSSSSFGFAAFSVGPMYTVSLGDKLSLDLKPQYAFSVVGLYKFDNYADYTAKGSGFVVGSSLNLGTTKGFKLSFNAEYTAASFKTVESDAGTYDIDEDNKFNSFVVGLGLRYNF